MISWAHCTGYSLTLSDSWYGTHVEKHCANEVLRVECDGLLQAGHKIHDYINMAHFAGGMCSLELKR